MSFNIPSIKLPTESELTKRSNSYVELMSQYSISSFGATLKAHTMPFAVVNLTRAEVESLIDERSEVKTSIMQKLNSCLVDNNWDKFFIKYFSRSAKDANVNMSKPYEFKNSELAILDMKFSMRCFEDFVSSYRTTNTSELNLIVRPFVDFKRNNEFRAFFKRSELHHPQLMITQYYKEYGETDYSSEEIFELGRQLTKVILLDEKYENIEDFVFDFYIEDSKPILIETNPYYLSDPILFRKDYKETLYDNPQSTVRIAATT